MSFLSGAQGHLGVTVKSPLAVDHSDEESNRAPAEQSGHTHPAEVITVTDDSDVPDLNSEPVTSSVSVTLSTPSVEVEASSPEIIPLMPESIAPSGAVPLEDIQDKQEGLAEKPTVFLSTTQNITHSGLERREKDAREGSSGESSGEGPEVKSPTLSMDQNEAGTDVAPPSGVKITLIPRQTLTPSWEPEPSAPAPQESRSDQEYSAEPPVAEEPEEQEVAAEITTSSINGNFKGIRYCC